jgi:hypothetical protein
MSTSHAYIMIVYYSICGVLSQLSAVCLLECLNRCRHGIRCIVATQPAQQGMSHKSVDSTDSEPCTNTHKKKS